MNSEEKCYHENVVRVECRKRFSNRVAILEIEASLAGESITSSKSQTHDVPFFAFIRDANPISNEIITCSYSNKVLYFTNSDISSYNSSRNYLGKQKWHK